jgi:hypothetical protein
MGFPKPPRGSHYRACLTAFPPARQAQRVPVLTAAGALLEHGQGLMLVAGVQLASLKTRHLGMLRRNTFFTEAPCGNPKVNGSAAVGSRPPYLEAFCGWEQVENEEL